MYHVKGSISLDVTLGTYKVPEGGLALRRLILSSDLVGLVPLMEIIAADTSSNLQGNVVLSDGLPITIVVGKDTSTRKSYSFRLFNPQESTLQTQRVYKLTGYLDVPKYFVGSSAGSYTGTTSAVMQQIAGQCGLTAAVDETSDTQTWYQANLRYGAFAKTLCKHGYINDTSIMALGVTLEKNLIYRDVNTTTPSTVTFSYSPEQNEIQIVDHRVVDAFGASNVTRGYRDRLVGQNLDQEAATIYQDIQIRPKSQQIAVNKGLQGTLDRARVDFTPAHHTDMVHENYFKARHQNTRGQFLNSAKLEILTTSQTQVNLFDTVTVNLQNVGVQGTGSSSSRDGLYVVMRKNLVVEGKNYGERFTLIRAGTNNG